MARRSVFRCCSAFLWMTVAVACTPTSPPPTTEPAPPGPSIAPASASPIAAAVPTSAPSAAGPVPVASVAAGGAPAPEPAPPAISCQDDDGCWLERGPDGRDRPIARPKKLRGKKLRPCKDTEHTPACRDGVCVVRAWKC